MRRVSLPRLFALLWGAWLCVGAVGCGGEGPAAAGRKDASVDTDAGVVSSDPDGGTPGADAGTQDAGPPPELKVFELLPPRAPTGGNVQVLIKGQGFIRGFAERGTQAKLLTTVKLGQNPSQDLQIIDDETMDVRAPPGVAGLTQVTVENPNGRFVCSGCFTYFEELVLASMSPKAGPLRGGNKVVLQGQGFTPNVQVNFGSLSSPRVTRLSSTQLEVTVPRGLQGGLVDVAVYDKNGVGTLRRTYRYVDDLRVTAVTPAWGPAVGGTSVLVAGQGFEPETTVRFNGVPATQVTVQDATSLTAISPAAAGPGAVDVAFSTSVDAWTARKAFAYVTGTGSALYGVFPHVGPSAGGNTVTLTGEGLDASGLEVRFGGRLATVSAASATQRVVTVPAQVSGGAPQVDVQVSAPSLGTLTLSGGYTYRMGLTGLSPAVGSSTGGTAVTLTGHNFPSTVEVFVGASPAHSVQGGGAGPVTLVTPPGSGGAPSDVWVRDGQDPENEALLPGAFTFEEPLSVGRVQPDRGAIAGGTLVTVLGAGFGEGTVVDFGTERAKDIKIVDPHTLTCRTPRGTVGTLDIRVRRGTASDTLPGGFSYFDPRSISGGVSGGPLTGTLNVTVLDSTQGFYGAPVPLVSVMLGTDTSTPLQGLTDARGQVTFSDPSLVKPQLVTAWKTGYETVSVSAVASENLTVFIARTGGEGEPGSPTGIPPAVISGKVTGFKPPRPLGPTESLEARVFVAQLSLQQGPPFRAPGSRQGQKWQVVKDGGDYTVVTSAGLRAVYALLGVKDSTQGTFTPHLMGVRRGITVSPDQPAQNQDIVLDMHLDQTVPVMVDGPLSPNGTPAVNALYAWLDLGAEGFIPNPANWLSGLGSTSSVRGTGATFSFPHFPRLDGANFLFLNEATTAQFYPVSYFYRRQPGDMSRGVTVGPLLPAPQVLEPTQLSRFTGTVRWATPPGPLADVQQVLVLKLLPLGTVTLWSMVLPGTQTQLTLPQPAVDKLRQEEATSQLLVAIFTSRSPKFSYNQWTYDALSGQSWSSYTLSISDVFQP